MMKNMLSAVLTAAVIVGSGPVVAATAKETDCRHQRNIVAAVQRARLNRVSEKKVVDIVLAGEVNWPENYNNAIPIFAAEVYKLKMRDLKKTDVGAQWEQVCLAN